MDTQTTLYFACLIIVIELLVILKYDYKMNKKNKLPKYWCVKNDGSRLFKDTVINYIKSHDTSQWEGAFLWYYGYEGIAKHNWNGFNVNRSLEKFINNPKVLTLQEFIELTTETTKVEQVEFKDDFDKITNKTDKCYYCYKTGYREFLGIKIMDVSNELLYPEKNRLDRDKFYFFKTKIACYQYLDSIHNKTKVVNNEIFKSTELTLNMSEIKNKLSKHYDKHDVEDIMQVLTK